jgi:hypothetical protein
MGPPLLGRHLLELQSASGLVIAVAAAGSFVGQIAAVMQAAPLWMYVVAALAPWLPILLLELIWTYRHYRWLALFCLLILTQSLYLLDQVARMIQVHILNVDPAAAAAIFGALGVERVHVVWTVWAVLGLLLLVSRFPRNWWLWATLLIAAWDVLNHTADVQFFNSVLEIGLLNLAFAVQLGHTYDAWLAHVFPHLPEPLLIDTTGRLEEITLRAGERLEHAAEQLYIVTSGTGRLFREGPGGHEILLRVLGPGQVIRDGGTLLAETPLEMLVLPANAI